MKNWFGTTGTITCPTHLGITIKSIQSDVSDPATTDVSVVVSGSLGTRYAVSAVSPLVADLVFMKDEDINVSATGTSLNGASINYITRGDSSGMRMVRQGRAARHLPGKWQVPASGWAGYPY